MQIDLTDAGTPELRLQILAPLAAHNAVATGREDKGGRVAILLRDAQGDVEGGMYATHWMDWMKLEYAFLPEPRRGQGLGRRMLATLEHAAIGRGCNGVWLNSFSVQAPGFYEVCGYRVVGRIPDRPRGHEDVFLTNDRLGQSPATMVVDLDPDPAHRETLRAKLVAWTNERIEPSGSRPLAITVRNESGEVIGGLWGHTGRGWLYVDLFGLPPELRRDRVGSKLLAMAEEEAKARGCIGSFLDTFTFQARPFYEKQGYRLFGQIDDFPKGHSRFFLMKRWAE